jgi:two-component system CheB/CheR fusion protein
MNDNERKVFEFPPPDRDFIPSTLPFPVVGIGASAGGIEALSRFLEAMPAENGMAFVVVIHLSPKYESNLDKILQTKTRMPVTQVTEVTPVEAGHVYLISPALDLLMNDGSLQVVSAARPRGRHVAIDMFFRTLAEVHRERAIGIILSGAGSDGAVGIARIKEKGGLTFVQSLDDAEYDSMPRSALERGTVDVVLPASEMPQKLLELSRNARVLQLPPAGQLERSIHIDSAEAQAEEAESALREILQILHQRTGHDFKHYKRATVLRRIERRLQVRGLADVIAYRHYLEEHNEEAPALLQDMLISVTNFFRDRSAFEALERDVIPHIFQEAKETEQIRAWSVGCATGEEAYSIAMLFADQNNLLAKPRPVQVFASDIDERAIAAARTGRYPGSIVTDVTPTRLRQYFDRQDEHFCVKREIREKVLFAIHNILQDPPFSQLHLISCRNLLIYLDRDIQTKVLEILHYALRPNGYLFLGTAESAEAVARYFTPVDKKNRIYRAANVRSEKLFHVPPLIGRSEHVPVKATANSTEQQRASPQDLYCKLVEVSGPPGMLIDRNHQIIYATQQALRFLRYSGGEPSHDIMATLHPDLQLEFRAALFEATQNHVDMRTRFIPIHDGNAEIFVRINIHPARDNNAATGVTLLVFEEREGSIDTGPSSLQNGDNVVALHLEQELTQTKEQLRSVIEQYETTLEDLKGSNEELQASNEELRSTAEELETSKEELQSINEELITVNNELKMKVDETAKSNDDLQNFLSATEIAVLFIDRNLRIKRYSKPCTRLFNLISSDIDRSILDITYRLDYPALEPDIEQVFDTLQPVEREVRGTNDGTWYIARLLPYRTAADRIEGLVLSFIDISRRKLAEEKLCGSERQMRLIAASTRDYAITTLDNDGIITSWNSGAERLFGYLESEIVGQGGDILFTPEDRNAGVFKEELHRAQVDGRSEDDRWHVRRNGTRIFCSGITSPLVDDGIGGFVKIARDLTDSKWRHDQQDARLESEKQERIRAEEAARVRDEFFAVLSHELKQPLNLIQLTAEMLSRIPEAATLPAIVRGTGTIKRMVKGQARIIDDLMDLSRLHTGKLTLTYSQLDLSERVSQVVKLMEEEAKQKKLTLQIDVCASELIIQGDLVRIEQIVWNLLSNALKFTPQGGTVHVQVRREADDMACIEVTDTGSGIAPELLPHIFDMFRQGNNGTARQYEGMGIGLALVKELVHSHGGRVEAESRGEGLGAAFRVYFPATNPHFSVPATDTSRTRSLVGKRILLVDDSVETVEALAALLANEGAQVTSALGAAQALELVGGAAETFHLIISDIGMPEMDGYGLLAALRALQPTASTPAIALSGFTRPSDVNRALSAGFETHIRKPVDFDQFIATAARVSQ